MADQPTSLAQRSLEKLYFDHKDMDFYLSWIMGREVFQGSDAQECLDTAAQITEGDPYSWQSAWRRLAERVEAQAQDALDQGDAARARSIFLRACTYYRAPMFIMKADAPEFAGDWQKMRACFLKAASLSEPTIERVSVPFQGKQLDGYFWTVDASQQKRPALLVFGGIETFAEDCYFMIASAGSQRGYNVLAVDLPGQGVNPFQGLTFGARMETSVSAVIDYALSRPEVDADRLAAFGFSWGGHIVFKGGRFDKRIKALIANPPMPDVFRSALAQQGGQNRNDPVLRSVFDQLAWRMGLRISWNPVDIARRFVKAYDYLVHGKVDVSRITCPVFCMAGEGEAPITLTISRECYEQLPNPKKKLAIFTKDEGGEAHCQVNNLPLLNRALLDWLDEMFA